MRRGRRRRGEDDTRGKGAESEDLRGEERTEHVQSTERRQNEEMRGMGEVEDGDVSDCNYELALWRAPGFTPMRRSGALQRASPSFTRAAVLT